MHHWTANKKYHWGIVLALMIATLNCLSQNSISADSFALDSFKQFVMKQQSALLQLKSFEMNGTVKITINDEYLKDHPAPKISNVMFSIWAQGTQLKEILKYLNDSGTTYRTETYYLTPTQVIEVDDLNGRVAKIFP